MAVRKNPSLSEILDAFKSAQAKTAEEMVPEEVCPTCGGAGCPDCMPVDPECDTCGGGGCPDCADPECDTCGGEGCPDCNAPADSEDLLGAAEALAGASEAADVADAEVVDAAETLKDMADEFINEHTASLRKEAQLFGQLFAASAMEEMNKTAALRDTCENAYRYASQVLDNPAAENLIGENMNLTKTASCDIYTEAYRNVMAKFAGFEDADEAEEAYGQELSPEDLAALADAAEEAPAEDAEEIVEDADYTYDELAELAAQISEDTGAEVAPEDVAEAANILSEAREGEIDEDAIAESAYQDALDQMGA